MRAKQAVDGGNVEVLTAIMPLHQVEDPVRVTLMVTMAVVTVVHNLAVIGLAQLVNLPEDDTVVTGAPQTIAQCRPLHLLLSEIALGDTSPTESTFRRQPPLP